MTNSVSSKRRDCLRTSGATQENLFDRNGLWRVAIDPFVLTKLPMFVRQLGRQKLLFGNSIRTSRTQRTIRYVAGGL